MNPILEDAFISATFGELLEVRSNMRYKWNNNEREKDPYVIVQWTLNGWGNFTCNGVTHRVEKDHAFIALVPEESSYHYPATGKEPWKFMWVNFYSPLAVTLWNLLRERFGPVVPMPAGSPAALQFRNITETAHNHRWKDRYENSLACYQFHLTLWNQLSAPRQSYRQNIDDAVRYLRTHYRDRLRVKELAAYSGMSREHFTRVFHERFKKSPASFLREERLQAAARLLKSTHLPVQEIAFRTGFYSHAQFSNLFRRHFRKTPLRYRGARQAAGRE